MKISVIIPVYNVERYLRDCLDSVLRQNIADMEVICIDDCSPDGSGALLEEYAARDGRIRVLRHSVNEGVGRSRNEGLAAARGEYVYFLDSDDMITEGALEKMLRTAEDRRLDCLLFDFTEIYETEALRKKYSAHWPSEMIAEPEEAVLPGPELLAWYFGLDHWACFIQCQFWRREHLIRTGAAFPEDLLHEDEWFSFYALFTARRAGRLNETLFIHRLRPASGTTETPGPGRYYAYLGTYLKIAAFMDRNGITHPAAWRYLRNMQYLMNRWKKLSEADAGSDADRAIARNFLAEPDSAVGAEALAAGRLLYRYLPETSEMLRIGGMCPVLPETGVRRVFLYGAGKVGRAVFLALLESGQLDRVEMAGFLVTGRKEGEEFFCGRPVTALDEYVPEDGDLIVISAGKKYREEIAAALAARGLSFITVRS